MDVDTTRPSICMKIGHGEWSPNSKSVGDLSWQCKASGDGWAIWEDKRFAAVRRTAAQRVLRVHVAKEVAYLIHQQTCNNIHQILKLSY